MPVRLTILQEIWWYSGMEPFWCIQCCNKTHCNLQTLLCVEKAMLVAISIDFHGQNYCFMWNFNTWQRKWQNLLQTAKSTWRFDPRIKRFVEMVRICVDIEFSLSVQLNILICFVICAQSLVLFHHCEYQTTNYPTFGAIRNYCHIIVVSLTIKRTYF